MHKSIKALAVTSAVIAALVAAPALYAHESKESDSSMMGPGMMDQGGMMGMMGQMSEMMEGCSKMMQSMHQGDAERPNEQWRKDALDNNNAPDTKG